jgi:heme exporter protein A
MKSMPPIVPALRRQEVERPGDDDLVDVLRAEVELASQAWPRDLKHTAAPAAQAARVLLEPPPVTSPAPLSPADPPRLVASALACRRGNRVLFKDLDLEVGSGEIVWVRGQNGSGKTSLLRLVAGLSTPEHGQVLFEGIPVRKAAAQGRRFVYVAHANALKDDLSVAEALEFLLRIHGRPCSEADVLGALERIGLQHRRHALVRTLSQGQRRRVALARLAVDDGAALWLLDEPFDALDIDGIGRLNGLLTDQVRRGGSVLLTSHLGVSTATLRPREVDLDAYA